MSNWLGISAKDGGAINYIQKGVEFVDSMMNKALEDKVAKVATNALITFVTTLTAGMAVAYVGETLLPYLAFTAAAAAAGSAFMPEKSVVPTIFKGMATVANACGSSSLDFLMGRVAVEKKA